MRTVTWRSCGIRGWLSGPSEGGQGASESVSLHSAFTWNSLLPVLGYDTTVGQLRERAVYWTHQKNPSLGVRRRRFISLYLSSSSLLLYLTGRQGPRAEHSPRAAPGPFPSQLGSASTVYKPRGASGHIASHVEKIWRVTESWRGDQVCQILSLCVKFPWTTCFLRLVWCSCELF